MTVPRLPQTPEEFRRSLEAYSTGSERALRDLQAARGEAATCPASNAFFRERLTGPRVARAVDLGCHDGRFAAEVLAPAADRLVLVDFSPAALEAAAARVPPAQLEATLQADLTQDWNRVAALGPFPLVALCEVIQHMPDAEARERVFADAAALVTPGGRLLFSTYFERPGEPVDGFFHSDRHNHLLFFHRASEAENTLRFGKAGLRVAARMREARVDAFVLSKPA